MKKTLILVVLALMLASMPSYVKAGFDFGRLIDPACFFACDNDKNTSNTTITNSYNTNSNINSTVTNNVNNSIPPARARNEISKTVVNTNPVIVTNPYYVQSIPTYTYPIYQQQQPTYSALGVSCYSTPTNGNVGESITWRASVYGGTGNYNVTWSGNDGLFGYGTSIYKTYNSSGSKYASVTVTSGNQTISQNCGNNVQIYDYNYSNNYYNNSYNYNSYDYYNYNKGSGSHYPSSYNSDSYDSYNNYQNNIPVFKGSYGNYRYQMYLNGDYTPNKFYR